MGKTSRIILIVEDNETIRETLKMGMEMEGFGVQEAGDGLEALDALKHNPLPGLIFLDILMPRMDGYEFLRQIKKDPALPMAKIPIFVISAIASDAERRLSQQVQGVFPKPVTLTSFLKRYDRIARDTNGYPVSRQRES